jgi:hypothetical protein
VTRLTGQDSHLCLVELHPAPAHHHLQTEESCGQNKSKTLISKIDNKKGIHQKLFDYFSFFFTIQVQKILCLLRPGNHFLLLYWKLSSGIRDFPYEKFSKFCTATLCEINFSFFKNLQKTD